jgi:tetratricopeptide (TPR) repeat protein
MTIFMLKSLPRSAGRAALVLSAVALPAVPAAGQYIGSAPPPPDAPLPGMVESPEAALARNVRLIARNPRNFQALVAAGRAALGTGDTQAAVGFFGRAEEVSPTSWQAQAGMGAAAVAMGDPQGALTYFARAQQYGATQMHIAVDRGLAFDLLGDQAKAQSDYRVALLGAEGSEARRRLALSLAISRDIRGAATTIEPLLQRRDPEAVRINAFILALAGDREGARRTIDAAMPGAGQRFEPFFKMLPVLRSNEKAAAVHLGIFPKDAAQRYAQAEPAPSSPVVSIGNSSRPRQASTPSQPRREAKKPVKLAEAPRRAVREAPKPSTYMASVRPSLDPSRYASTRRPKTEPATQGKADAGGKDPEPRPAGRLDDIAQLLSETDENVAAPTIEVAQAHPPESTPPQAEQIIVEPAPEPAFSAPAVSRPKVEPPKTRTALSKPKVETAKQAAADKAKAEKLAAEKKAKAEAAKLGVDGTNWVQLAGGSNQDRMEAEYKKLAAKAGKLLQSRSGYVTEGKDYFRLLVGPFASKSEAQAFVNKLEKEGVDGFSWTRTPAQIRIEKLKT